MISISENEEGFKKTVSVAYILAILAQISEILFFFVLYKFFSVEVVGFFGWAMAIATFFSFSLDLGLSQTLIRGFSQAQLDLKRVAISSFVLRLPIIIAALIVFQVWLVYYDPPREQCWMVFWVGMIQILIMGERICQSWLRANSRQITANIIAMLGSIGRLGAALILIYFLNVLSVMYLFIAIFFVHIMIFPSALFVTYYGYCKVSMATSFNLLEIKATIEKLWVPSLIFALIGFFSVIQNRLDWLMVSGFVSKIELANYSLANKGYEVILMFIGVALITAYPWMCKDNPSQSFQTRLNAYLNLVICLGVTCSLVAALYMPATLEFLWGAKYEAANTMVQLLMLGAAFSVISGVLYHLLISKRLEKKILPVTIIATGFQILFNSIFIPKLGGFGATIGMLTLIVVTTVGLFWVVHREKIMTFSQLNRLLVFLVIMLLLAGVFWIHNISMVFGIFTLFVLGFMSMYFILITSGEKKLLFVLVRNYFNGIRKI